MRTSKFTPEQMVHIVRRGDSGVPIVALAREQGSATPTGLLTLTLAERPGR